MKWYVVTPAYERYPSNAWGDPEPPEYGADVVEVEAPTKRKALVEGVRALRRTRSQWLRDQDGSPFTGLKAHGWTGICVWCEQEIEDGDEDDPCPANSGDKHVIEE